MTYSDADLLDALAEFADRHDGRAPTVSEANDRDDLPSATTYINHFGTWNDAIETAGLDVRNRQRSDEELLAALRRFAAERGAHPSYWRVEIADCDWMATPKTYENRFGSWNAALRKAGLPTFAAPDRETRD